MHIASPLRSIRRRTFLHRLQPARLSATLGLIGSLAVAGAAHAGPFAPAAGKPGSTAIGKDSASFVQWASGHQDYLPGPNVDATWKTPERALGKAQGTSTDIVVLGDAGRITLTFGGSIFNGAGADFAVFENSFSDTFLELAWVEVSSNGVDFFRFANYSFTPAAVGGFGSIDPTNIDGLAGKYRQGFGTPFDLDSLVGTPGLDVNNVRFVRLVDIVGRGGEFDSYPVAFGGPHAIYDPYPTTGSGGFDLDAVGVIHFSASAMPVPEPGTWALAGIGLLALAALRKRRTVRVSAALLASAMASSAGAATVVSTFDDLSLAPNSHFFPEVATTFTSGAARFNHDFDDFGVPGCCWSGWTHSNRVDTTTPGFENQYSAYAGGGAGGSANYALAYLGAPAVRLDAPSVIDSVDVTNTTYTALSMLQGDSFAKRFGGDSGDDADFLKLTFVGLDLGGSETGRVDFFLADYRFADNRLDHVVRDWTRVDLRALGTVAALRFEMSSSDVGSFGMNTPAYFAIDNLSVSAVPEVGSGWMAAAGLLGLLGLGGLGRQRRSTR